MRSAVFAVIGLLTLATGPVMAQSVNDIIRQTNENYRAIIDSARPSGYDSRPNPLGGQDYSNGVTSRPNPVGGYDYSNGVSCRPNPLGGMTCNR